jgi:hypothetical protein
MSLSNALNHARHLADPAEELWGGAAGPRGAVCARGACGVRRELAAYVAPRESLLAWGFPHRCQRDVNELRPNEQ